MSVNAIQAQGTKLYIAGSSGSAADLSAITVGFPTFITVDGHGLADGDKITLAGFTGDDAATLNGLTFVVQNHRTGTTDDTFTINLDTTGKAITIGAATATPLAWIQVKELKSFKPGGATASTIDVTDLDSPAKEYKTGLQDSGTFTVEFNALDTDAGQSAVRAAFTGALSKSFKVVYPAGSTPNRTFTGSVTKYSTTNDAAVDGVITGNAEIRISGSVTVA